MDVKLKEVIEELEHGIRQYQPDWFDYKVVWADETDEAIRVRLACDLFDDIWVRVTPGVVEVGKVALKCDDIYYQYMDNIDYALMDMFGEMGA